MPRMAGTAAGDRRRLRCEGLLVHRLRCLESLRCAWRQMRGRVQCKEMPAAAGTVTMAQLQRWLEVMAEPQYLEQVLPT